MKDRTRLPLKIALIAVLGWWIHSPAFHGEWLWDDTTSIAQNPLMRDPAGLRIIWFAPVSLDYYPLQTSVEWIQWHLWGANTFGYHLTNVVLQILSACLFWAVLRKLAVPGAWLGGLLLIVHPMTVESVAWIVELKNTLSLSFLLLSMLCYLEFDGKNHSPPAPSRSSGKRWYAASFLLFVLALLSKSAVVMFPCVLLLHAWWKRGRVAWRDAAAAAPFFAASLALGVVTLQFQTHRAIGALPAPHVGGVLSRAAVAGISSAFYLWKFLAPVNLMPIYPHWSVDPPSLLQFLPWVGIIAILVLLARAGRRGLLFGAGCFLINLLPVSGLFTASYMRLTWVMDHLAYVSILGLMGIAAAGAGALLAPSFSRAWRLGAGLALALALAGLALASHAYARAFSSGEAFWSMAVSRNPAAWAAQYNLAVIEIQAGHLNEAIPHLEAAVRLKPDYTEAHINLANALCQEGRYAEAMGHFETALRLDPSNAAAHYNLGVALRALGRPEEARAQWLEASRLLGR